MTVEQVIQTIRERAESCNHYPEGCAAHASLLWAADLVEKELLHSVVVECFDNLTEEMV